MRGADDAADAADDLESEGDSFARREGEHGFEGEARDMGRGRRAASPTTMTADEYDFAHGILSDVRGAAGAPRPRVPRRQTR